MKLYMYLTCILSGMFLYASGLNLEDVKELKRNPAYIAIIEQKLFNDILGRINYRLREVYASGYGDKNILTALQGLRSDDEHMRYCHFKCSSGAELYIDIPLYTKLFTSISIPEEAQVKVEFKTVSKVELPFLVDKETGEISLLSDAISNWVNRVNNDYITKKRDVFIKKYLVSHITYPVSKEYQTIRLHNMYGGN